MILVYNETEKPMWELQSKNDNYFRLVNKEVPSFTFGIFKHNIQEEDFNKDVLNTVNCLNNFGIFYEKNTMVRFDKWQLRPFMKSSNGDFNTNIVLATFDIGDGRRVINIRNYNSYIYNYHYDYDKKQLFIIFSMNESIQKACLEILCEEVGCEDGNPKVYLKVFHLAYGSKDTQITGRVKRKNEIPEIGHSGYIHYMDNSIDTFKFKMRNYIPVRLTHCIILLDKADKELLTPELLKKNHIHGNTANIIEPPESGTLRNTLRELNESRHIKAVTFVVPNISHGEVKGNEEKMKEVKDLVLVKNYGNYFDKVFVMDKEGQVYIVK